MDKKKKKKKGGLVKQLSLILGITAAVIILAVVVINAISKSSIKYITIEGAYRELYVGNPEYGVSTMAVNVYPASASTASLKAFSSNKDVATVEFDGANITISAVGEGEATITVQNGSKESLKDTIKVLVKDQAIEDLTFVTKGEDGEIEKISDIDVKKDGFEHRINFDLNPADANMNNLKVSYDDSVLDDAFIDQETKSLVVIPKTDIVQTSTAVDVEIYQNTESGYVAAQYARLQLNLKAREAYIRFNLSADAENYSLNHSNIVYLERTNATDVYVRPEIGYDVDFESTSDFNTKDYNISFDGESITWDSSKSFSYNNKLSVSRANSGYYYFKTLPGFVSGDHIYVSFQHKFTGAVNSLQFIYLDIDTLGLNNYRSLNISNLKQNENTGCIDLELNEVVALSFSYDNGVKYSVVEIYTFTMSDDGIVPTSSFGDQLTDETIVIEKVAEKIFLKAVALTKETNVYFGIKCEYWDLRYVRISEGTNRLVKFSVSNSVNDICVQKDGVETNYQEIGKAGLVSVDVVALPYGSSVINSQDITYTVTKDGVAVSDVTVTRNETTGKFDILSKLTSSGTYKIEFNYNEFKTSLYLVVK